MRQLNETLQARKYPTNLFEVRKALDTTWLGVQDDQGSVH